MLRHFAFAAALFAFAGLSLTHSTAIATAAQPTNVAQASLPPLFDTAQAAQAHCPKAVAVWLNTPSGIYHFKGERWHGRTKHGAYPCEKEAIKAGDRASENGQ